MHRGGDGGHGDELRELEEGGEEAATAGRKDGGAGHDWHGRNAEGDGAVKGEQESADAE